MRGRLLLILMCAFALAGCSASVMDGADSGAPPDGEDSGVADDGGTDAGAGDSGVVTGTDAGTWADAGSDAGTFVAVVVGYGARRASSTDGLHWSNLQQSGPDGGDDNDLFRGIGYGDGTFVAVGGSSVGLSMTSTDGVTWENQNQSATSWIGNVVWLDGSFVAAGGNGLRMRSLDKGATWQDFAPYEAIHYRDVMVGMGVVVAVGHTYAGTGIIENTADGVSWTGVYDGGTSFNYGAFGNGSFVALGASAHCVQSTDGTHWNEVTLAGTAGNALVFTGTEFLASIDSTLYRSTDGVQWTSQAEPNAVNGFFAGEYLSFGWPATIAASTNLSAWNTVYAPMGSGFTRMVSGWVAQP
jgi:hypothetical protein